MMKRRFIFALFFSVVLACTLSGCVSFGDKTPPQKNYLLTLNTGPIPKKHLTKFNLLINEVTAVPPYNMGSFIYRVSKEQYLSDYYHVFMVSPPAQLTDLFSQYFLSQPLFENVQTSATQTLNPDYEMQIKLLALYADYRHSARPMAVMTFRLGLYKNGKDQALLYNKVYTARVPLAAKTNPALVVAWNQALRQLLPSMYADVKHAVLD